MESGEVRRRLIAARAAARGRARSRRERSADAERAWTAFLTASAAPLVQQLAQALRAEGIPCTVYTPEGRIRLAFDRSRDDYIEIALDTGADPPQVAGRVSERRGSRIVEDERPVAAGVPPQALTEDALLDFLLAALAPWLER